MDENASLSDMQKFYHLISSLGDESCKIISKLNIKNENYGLIWNDMIWILTGRLQTIIFSENTKMRNSETLLNITNNYDMMTKILFSEYTVFYRIRLV